MALYGIDISEHQGNINLAAYNPQFVIIRAGVASRADRKLARNVAECKRLGIPFGVYWYTYAMNTAQAVEETDIFLRTIAPYKNDIRCGVWVDQEDTDHYKANHGLRISNAVIAPMTAAMCAKLEAAGYYTGIYCAQSWLPYLRGTCDRYDKWVASWGPNNGAETTNTSALGTMHQYTSVPLDRDVCYVDLSTYNKGKKVAPKPAQPSQPAKKGNEQIATEVIDGKWGNGDDRKNRLSAAGYDYNVIQAIVNRKAGAKPAPARKSNDQIATEVIDGKWGNDPTRSQNLKVSGYDPAAIQAIVNRKLGAGSAKAINYNDLARRTIRGEFGNYPQRKRILDSRYGAGTYDKVQAIINRK